MHLKKIPVNKTVKIVDLHASDAFSWKKAEIIGKLAKVANYDLEPQESVPGYYHGKLEIKNGSNEYFFYAVKVQVKS